MADPTVYAATDEAFGFVKNLTAETTAQGPLEVMNGAGVIKSKLQWGLKTRVSGTFIYQGSPAAWSAQVGTGTAITITDTDIGGAATVFLESFTLRKAAGDSMAAFEFDFVGWEYPSLTV